STERSFILWLQKDVILYVIPLHLAKVSVSPHYFALTAVNAVVPCLQEMTRGNRYKTIRWRFVESLEPPRVVHARCPDMVTKGNLYGQVTVRMHSKQV
ncbi:hypothetical protein GOODEAATRI_011360, partial [Goodea atripinnis]